MPVAGFRHSHAGPKSGWWGQYYGGIHRRTGLCQNVIQPLRNRVVLIFGEETPCDAGLVGHHNQCESRIPEVREGSSDSG